MTATTITPDHLVTIGQRTTAQLGTYKSMLMVCTGTACVSAKGFVIK